MRTDADGTFNCLDVPQEAADGEHESMEVFTDDMSDHSGNGEDMLLPSKTV